MEFENRTGIAVTSGETVSLDAGAGAVEALADHHDEPGWMREKRRIAWQMYEKMEWPHSKEEAWRRLPLQRYPLEDRYITLTPYRVGSLEDLPPCWQSPLVPEPMVDGILVHQNGAEAYAALAPRDEAQGVVLMDLHRALQTHEDLIREHWMSSTIARPDFNKFTALHAALWHGGTFVYVPAGVRVVRPLQSLVGYDHRGGMGLHHTLIVVEKGARVTLLQDRISQERAPELNAEVVEIYAGEGAWVRYASLQHWGSQRYTVSVQNATLDRDAHLLWAGGALGGAVTKEFLRTDLLAPGARGLMQGFTFAKHKQQIDQSTYQHHRARDTYSDLLFRNVLKDQARTVFYGMIRVEPEAQQTQGYQANNNLLLDHVNGKKPRANSIPGLEILANEVSCSHGATVSRIDEEELFYLQSRAIARPQAEELIVRGFLRPIIEQFPLACVRDQVDEELAHRFESK